LLFERVTAGFVAEGHIGGYGGSSPREISLVPARDTMAVFAIARRNQPIARRNQLPHPADSNLYPSPRTVTMCRGLAGSVSIFARSRLMCTSRVLVSPT